MTPVVFRVRKLRKDKGWSQQVLAKRSGARQATISDMERGKAKRVDLDVLEALARALECKTINDLMVLDLDGENAPKSARKPAAKKRGRG